MEHYLFDTSALVKRYHVEVGSPKVAQIFVSPSADVLISDITVQTFLFLLDQKKH